VLQSVHTTSNHETSVEPDKEYQVENILEKRMISEKPTISSNERVQHLWKHMRTHRKPQQLCKNTSALWEGGDKIKLSKVVWHVIKSWNKVSGWGVSSSSLSLLIFFNRQRVFCLAQSWVWHNVLCNQESFAKRRACSSSVWRISDFSLLWHS
jgi:hypothetical protein